MSIPSRDIARFIPLIEKGLSHLWISTDVRIVSPLTQRPQSRMDLRGVFVWGFGRGLPWTRPSDDHKELSALIRTVSLKALSLLEGTWEGRGEPQLKSHNHNFGSQSMWDLSLP